MASQNIKKKNNKKTKQKKKKNKKKKKNQMFRLQVIRDKQLKLWFII